MPTATLLQFLQLGETDDQTAAAMDPIPELPAYAPARKAGAHPSDLVFASSRASFDSDGESHRSRRSSWIEPDDAKPIPWGASSPVMPARSSIELNGLRRRASFDPHRRRGSGASSANSIARRASLSIDTLPLAESGTLPPLTPASLRSSSATPSPPSSAAAEPASAHSSASSVNLSNRSRVSLDAVSPVQAMGSTFDDAPEASTSALPPVVRALAGAKAFHPIRPPTLVPLSTTPEGGSYESGRVQQRTKHVDDIFSVEPDEQEADEISAYSSTHRNVVDATLRSTPGVVGLGEGWAGGPQPKKKWYGRKLKRIASDDPLALWTAEDAPNTASSVNGLWALSTKNLFSTPDVRSSAGSDRAHSSKRPPGTASRLFSKSKLIVSAPEETPSPRKLKRNSLAALTRASFLDLSGSLRGQQAPELTEPEPRASRSSPNLFTLSALGSRSQPSLFPEQPLRQHQRLSRESYARSDTNLASFAKAPMQVQVPPRRSSLSPTAVQVQFARPLGPPGPLLEVDEEEEVEDAFTPAPQPISFPLRRTTTFGTDKGAAQVQVDPPVTESERDAAMTSMATVAVTTPSLETDEMEQATSPRRKPQRRPSLMNRLRSAFTRASSLPTTARPPSSLSMGARSHRPASRLFTRGEPLRAELIMVPLADEPVTPHMPGSFPFPRTMEVSGVYTHNPEAYHVSQSVVESMIALPSLSRSATASPSPAIQPASAPRRRVSWRGPRLSTDNLLKRLSKLAEDDGEGPDGGSKRGSTMSLPRSHRLRHQSAALGHVFPRPPVEASERPGWAYPSTLSMSAYSHHASSQLSLDVDLGSPHLGLEEIIDTPRRVAFIESSPDLSAVTATAMPRARKREAALASTAATLSANARSGHGHNRGMSDEPRGAAPHVAKHSRHKSVPINVDHLASSSSDSLADLTAGGAIIDFPLPPRARAGVDGEKAGGLEQLTDAAGKAPVGRLGVPIGVGGGGKSRLSVDSKRYSVGSSVSADSFDPEHAVETRAVRMTPRKASYIGFDTISPFLAPMAEMPTPLPSPGLAA
ncbi:hypothetical protein Q5752_006136 [Cryptotrichosporon argae]